MRLLVTGATGFLGSHFANAAIEAGHEVVALRHANATPCIQVSERVHWLYKTLSGVTSADLSGVHVFVHFAAAGVLPASASWSTCFGVNVMDSISAWHAAVDIGVRRLIVCGSCFEYGAVGNNYQAIPPTARLLPTGPYHASKAAATMAAIALAQEKHLECAVLRPFHVYGPGEHSSRFWPSLRLAAASGADFPMTYGEQVRDFTPVADVAKKFLDVCANRPLTPGQPEVHNVGSGRPTTLLAFAEYWWTKWGATGRLIPGAIPYRPGEVMRYVPELTL